MRKLVLSPVLFFVAFGHGWADDFSNRFFLADYALRDIRYALETHATAEGLTLKTDLYNVTAGILPLSYGGELSLLSAIGSPISNEHGIFMVFRKGCLESGLRAGVDVLSCNYDRTDIRDGITEWDGPYPQYFRASTIEYAQHTRMAYSGAANLMFRRGRNTLSLAIGGVLLHHTGYKLTEQFLTGEKTYGIQDYEPRDLSKGYSTGGLYVRDVFLRRAPFYFLAGAEYIYESDTSPVRTSAKIPAATAAFNVPQISFWGSEDGSKSKAIWGGLRNRQPHRMTRQDMLFPGKHFLGATVREFWVRYEKSEKKGTENWYTAGGGSQPDTGAWSNTLRYREIAITAFPELALSRGFSLLFPVSLQSMYTSWGSTRLWENHYDLGCAAAMLSIRCAIGGNKQLEVRVRTGDFTRNFAAIPDNRADRLLFYRRYNESVAISFYGL